MIMFPLRQIDSRVAIAPDTSLFNLLEHELRRGKWSCVELARNVAMDYGLKAPWNCFERDRDSDHLVLCAYMTREIQEGGWDLDALFVAEKEPRSCKGGWYPTRTYKGRWSPTRRIRGNQDPWFEKLISEIGYFKDSEFHPGTHPYRPIQTYLLHPPAPRIDPAQSGNSDKVAAQTTPQLESWSCFGNYRTIEGDSSVSVKSVTASVEEDRVDRGIGNSYYGATPFFITNKRFCLDFSLEFNNAETAMNFQHELQSLIRKYR